MFRALLSDEGQSLLAALGDAERAGDPALRHGRPAALVAAAEEQVRLREQAAAKFGEFAPRLYLTPDLVELSSHLAVADYKLDRVLAEFGVVLIDAIGLGNGLDAHLLSWSHHTTAVDPDPLAVEIAGANAPVVDAAMLFPQRQDAASFDSQGEAVFVDLMRRPGPDGAHDPESWSPPLSWALERVRTTGLGWIRLAPGLAPGAVPDLGRAAEAEWISYDGEVQELVLWFGPHGEPAPVTVRRATLLPVGASLTARGLPEPPVRPPGRYVYVPDPAVVRAGLLAELAQDVGGALLDGGGALLTSDELRHTAFATAYEVIGVATHAPEPQAPVEFAVGAADGPLTLSAVPVPLPEPRSP
ncbi:SAM-dependent methyltransferase [Streptomyces venezuelae]|uniref:SAM-dependent methyltransferase n=1 Tax=Streptomyces venezuelae TaxID=54571 RepID=A0A5P2DSY1_STRVZ|nr:SAM-dependent methyltransferase [Streptomyces venezuelae]